MSKLLSGRRVLVVEDEMMILMILEDMLADLGCESVTGAATVGQGLAFGCQAGLRHCHGNRSDAVADALAAHGVPFVFQPVTAVAT
jgi:CheY-like chemotaxis protein